MDKQFKHYRGAVPHLFVQGRPVLAKACRNGKEKWIQGYIVHRAWNAIYDVDLQSSIWVENANQLHHSCPPKTKINDTVIPLNIFLDMFVLPQSVLVTLNTQPYTGVKRHIEKAKE